MPLTANQDFAAYQLCRDKTIAQLADIIRAPDADKAVRLAAVRALQQLDYAAIRPMIADLLDSPSARQRAAAAAVLGQMQTELDASERTRTTRRHRGRCLRWRSKAGTAAKSTKSCSGAWRGFIRVQGFITRFRIIWMISRS